MPKRGTIVAAFGRHYEIELADGTLATGYPRGKKSPFAVGDEVDLTADGQITAVGTMNMDIRSLRLHKELMVWMFDQELTRQLEGIFERDLLHCREMTLADVRSVGRWQRFRNSFARLFSAEI